MNNIKMIKASAGSGKTYSITEQIVDSINSGTPVEKIMATTFTNRAARELKERIKGELLTKHKLDEANHIYDAYIGTVNSICGHLLEEYSLDAGLSPNLKVISEEDSSRLFNIAIETAIEKIAPQIEPVAHRLRMDGKGSYYQKDSDWRNDVRIITELARRNKISSEQLKICRDNSSASMLQVLGTQVDDNLTLALETLLKDLLNNQNLKNQAASFKKASKECMAKIEDCYRNKTKLTWKDWADLAELKPNKDELTYFIPLNSLAEKVLGHPQLQNDIKIIIDGVFACVIDSLESYANYKKRHGLIDFIDQETIALDLLLNNEQVGNSIKEGLELFVVDEFQDTSPIQLALFLALNQIIKNSVWVGDPKQAIYGFRDTDPNLMNEVIGRINNQEVLAYSWRSRETLISFTNAIFPQVFHQMSPSEIILQIPNERKNIAQDGFLEIWYLKAPKKEGEIEALVNGVENLIQRNIKLGDIAILCRTNDNCVSVADTLEKAGVRTSLGKENLLDAHECHYALAALKYMSNPKNNLALIELANLLSPQKTEWIQNIMEKPKEISFLGDDNESIKALKEANPQVKYWTPLEALEQAIDRINLLHIIKSLSNPELALNNLEALKKHCQEYTSYSTSYMHSPTIDGFIAYLNEKNPSQAQVIDKNAVNVLTYHSAKGLEWPWVILTDLNTSIDSTIFGAHIEASPNFDPQNPLENRNIRYWPWPFGSKKSLFVLEGKIKQLAITKNLKKTTLEEAQRLLYVAMTRAKDGLVITVRKKELTNGDKIYAEWLDILKDKNNTPVLNWDIPKDTTELIINNSIIPVKIQEFHEGYKKQNLISNQVYSLPLATAPAKVEYLPARVNPSSLKITPDDKDEGESWQIIGDFASRISIKGKPEMDHLGNAIHGYLAIDIKAFPASKQIELARQLIKQWDMDTVLEPSELVTAGQNLEAFIAQQYAGYEIYREWPVVWVNENGQVLQGWIDMMLKSFDDYVIIDHKSYPGKSPEARVRKYAPQLNVYKNAIEKTSSKPVREILIHLPVSGQIVRMPK